MLELINIYKRYPVKNTHKDILVNASFHFKKGNNVGILGLNGAGKSTLLRIIAGAETPDSGQIKRTASLSWPMGFAGGFNGSLTGAENCRFIARLYGKDVKQVSQFTEEFSELKEHFYMPFKTYSSGMKSRLAFGLSMAIDFECYLIDEILSVGDQNFQKKCKTELDKRKQTSSLILVSHSPSKIADHCDSVLLLDKGKLVHYSNVESGLEAYKNLT